MIKKKDKNFLHKVFFVLSLCLCFYGVFGFCVSASESDETYADGYADGYSEGYNQGKNDIINSLDIFNILEFYYDSAILFISTDNGNTFASVSGQDYIISYDSTLKCLNVLKDSGAPWNANAIYYLNISFDFPLYVLNVRIPSSKAPNLQKVVVGEVNYSFNYGYYDDNPYFMTKDMYTNLTSNLQLYFTVNGGYINGDRHFNIYLDGYVFGASAYNVGYENGVKSLDDTVYQYKETINVLKEENNNLRDMINNSFGWKSLFFSMADIPFYTASNFLNFEIFGINLFYALLGFLTLLLIFFIIKKFIK